VGSSGLGGAGLTRYSSRLLLEVTFCPLSGCRNQLIQLVEGLPSPFPSLMWTMSKVQKLPAELVINDFGHENFKARVVKESLNSCRNWLVLLHGGMHELRKDVAVEEEWTRH